MSDLDQHYAGVNANFAADQSGPDQLTEAVGQGLSAVAFALLDLADAVRQTARSEPE
jgi:hypothetical protein